ncbi:MAG: hypothetical protein ABF379_15800 [Akkermansiaceae bacterium]
MKYYPAVICALSLLQSCAQKPEDEPTRRGPPEVQFITPWQPGVGMGLYVRTNDEPYPVEENIRNFSTIDRRQFLEKGIPPEAISAASFLKTGESRDDFQAVYAIKVDGQIQVYRGYFVPGFGGPVEWERVKLP